MFNLTKLCVLTAKNPFTQTDIFIKASYSSMLNLALTAFGVGFLFCALMIWKGDEESVHKFKKGAFWTGVGVVGVVLAKGIVLWISAGVSGGA